VRAMDRPACWWHAASVRFPRALIALPATLILALTLGGPIAVADPPAPPGTKASPAGRDHRSEQAEQALADVQAILDGHAASRQGRTADGRSLTLAMRDLIALRDALPAAQEEEAAAVLARPARDATSCASVICVHYKTSGNDAPSLVDNDKDGVPDYIEQVRDTTQQVHNDYVGAGYRRPKGDGTRGGNGENKVDIYIQDIGDDGLYGYCTSDQTPVAGDYTLWAYCVLDDDYDTSEFPTNTPLENMRVTAAHEYFHAVQYAYDAFEDGWILESTATWVEDEMFDSVNDNRNYLSNGPLRVPYVPLDTFGDGFHYGTWIWWRYLTEKFPAQTGKLPKLVLDVWKRLDGRPGGPDDYSTQGLARVLGNRNTTIKKQLQLFFGVNRHPRTYYEEGNAYNATPTGLNINYSGAQRKGAYIKLPHMSASRAVKLNPNGLSQRDWKLRFAFNAPPTARGGAFVVIVYKKAGGIDTSLIRLNRTGGGSKTVPFSSRRIDHVDLIFVNTSTRFTCWQSNTSPYSCLGTPKDDGLRSEFSAKAFRS
jgi:hypothetical protein